MWRQKVEAWISLESKVEGGYVLAVQNIMPKISTHLSFYGAQRVKVEYSDSSRQATKKHKQY